MNDGQKPRHFDRAAVRAAHERAEALLAESIAADPRKSPEQKMLELAGTPLRTAMIDFIVAAKEADIRHEIVAASVGGHLAQLAAQVFTNWTCPCVPATIARNFAANFEAMLEGRAEVVDGGTTYGQQGGWA